MTTAQAPAGLPSDEGLVPAPRGQPPSRPPVPLSSQQGGGAAGWTRRRPLPGHQPGHVSEPGWPWRHTENRGEHTCPVAWPPCSGTGPWGGHALDGHGRCCGKTGPAHASLEAQPLPGFVEALHAVTALELKNPRGRVVPAPGALSSSGLAGWPCAGTCAPQKQQQGVSAAQPPESRTREQNTGPAQGGPRLAAAAPSPATAGRHAGAFCDREPSSGILLTPAVHTRLGCGRFSS